MTPHTKDVDHVEKVKIKLREKNESKIREKKQFVNKLILAAASINKISNNNFPK